MFRDCEKSNLGGGRGLCNTHYVGCSQRIKKGISTWKEFEERGICRKKMSQLEKNRKQMHPHKSYKKREPVISKYDSKYDF